jgi:hypothetical protein
MGFARLILFNLLLLWCEEKLCHRPFVCFDARLAGAAEKAGFLAVT